MQILKYPLTYPACEVRMHAGAQILSVKEQNGVICVWALSNPENKKMIVQFRLFLTGETIRSEYADEMAHGRGRLQFRDTVQVPDPSFPNGQCVTHVFTDHGVW